MKRSLLCFAFFFCLINCFSQNGMYNIWYFGERAGLDFNTNPPTATSNSAMVQQEGCATICDNTGHLLFYSDGTSVWNRNHQVMPNGNGLRGGFSASQSVLVVPSPGNNNVYYIFTVPEEFINAPLCYSIIDMTLDAGLGDITAIKNVPLHTPVQEKLTATLKSNGVDYWVIAKEAGSDAFLVYSLTSAGVDPNPVISHIGFSLGSQDKLGYVRVSPNGLKLCIAYTRNSLSQLFDFDNITGILSNPIDLTTSLLPFGPYGIEFSPDNSKLYIM
ncbi:MAG: hypothetical protein QM737_04895 [Ferruginibacter sp.]